MRTADVRSLSAGAGRPYALRYPFVLFKPSARSAVALALIAAVALSGCSVFKKKKPTLAYEERPVELLFNVGRWISTSTSGTTR